LEQKLATGEDSRMNSKDREKPKILQKLGGGDLRSIGRANEVVQDILQDPALFSEVFVGLRDNDPVIRTRAADALEKVSAKHPEYLQPFKDDLINEISRIQQQEVQWHVAQMFSYLELNKAEKNKVIKILYSYIDTTESNIVKVNCMQTLSVFAERDESLRPEIIKKIKEMMKTGGGAIQAKGRKLLAILEIIRQVTLELRTLNEVN